MKLKVMSREIRVFVSLIVWLFSVTGADGDLTIHPQTVVLMRGSTATLHCASNSSSPNWLLSVDDMSIDTTDLMGFEVVNSDCKSIFPLVGSYRPGPLACDLVVKGTKTQQTLLFSCADDIESADAIAMFLESPLKCGIEDSQYSCSMSNSIHDENKVPLGTRLSSRLTWKDYSGNIIGSKNSDLSSTPTVVKAPIPAGPSRDSPHVCSVEFKIEDDSGTRHPPIKVLVPGGKLDCKFPKTAKDEQAARAVVLTPAAVAASAAAAAAASAVAAAAAAKATDAVAKVTAAVKAAAEATAAAASTAAASVAASSAVVAVAAAAAAAAAPKVGAAGNKPSKG